MESENVIVEFTTLPTFMIKKTGLLKLSASDYQNLCNRFSHALSALLNNLTKKSTIFKSSLIIKKNHKLFTGVNIEALKGLLTSISSLSHIKKIFKNNRVHPLENDILSKYNYSIKSGNLLTFFCL